MKNKSKQQMSTHQIFSFEFNTTGRTFDLRLYNVNFEFWFMNVILERY